MRLDLTDEEVKFLSTHFFVMKMNDCFNDSQEFQTLVDSIMHKIIMAQYDKVYDQLFEENIND